MRDSLAELLENISEVTGDPVAMTSLCAQVGIDPAAGPVIAELLGTLGSVRTNDTGELRLQASSPAAGFFLRSLAQYVRHGESVLGNWERPGTVEPPYTGSELLAGPQFLYLMERQRLARHPESSPLRTAEVAQVIIKRNGHYLAQYDNAARQFQLLGGYRRHSDASLHETAVRELEEELVDFAFDVDKDHLVELGRRDVVQLSRTYGVNTLYQMTFFHLRSTRTRLTVAPGARWLTEEQLLRSDDQKLAFAGVRELATTMVSVPDLAPSLPGAPRRSVWDVFRSRPWESSGLAIGIAGLILSVVFYVLS